MRGGYTITWNLVVILCNSGVPAVINPPVIFTPIGTSSTFQQPTDEDHQEVLIPEDGNYVFTSPYKVFDFRNHLKRKKLTGTGQDGYHVFTINDEYVAETYPTTITSSTILEGNQWTPPRTTMLEEALPALKELAKDIDRDNAPLSAKEGEIQRLARNTKQYTTTLSVESALMPNRLHVNGMRPTEIELPPTRDSDNFSEQTPDVPTYDDFNAINENGRFDSGNKTLWDVIHRTKRRAESPNVRL